MLRDPAALSRRTFDLLVVGGGIYGLTIAYDAAQRGLSVALIERGDFGGGSSFNHARTIHGGLRYLQSLDLGRSRESIRERRTLARIAPHCLAPTPFALPLSRSLTRGKLALRAAFLLDRLVAADRNQDLPPPYQLPGGRVLSRAAALERFPGLASRSLTGAAVWYDYVTIEADRLTFAWAQAAVAHGATVANYVEAIAPLVDSADGTRVVGVLGVRARDLAGGGEIDVNARFTINATGSAVDRLLEPLGTTSGLRFLKAMNLVTRRPAGREALGGRAPSGRFFFLVPYRSQALFGTWESTAPATSADGGVKGDEVDRFIGELNLAFPSLDLTREDVTLVHRGIVPAATGRNGELALEGHEQIQEAAPGLMNVVGTKYTTARAVAEKVTTRVLAHLKMAPVACRTALVPLPAGNLKNVPGAMTDARERYDELVPSDTIPHIVAAYGSRYSDVLDLVRQSPDLGIRMSETSPVIGAELAWAARHEMVVTLADAVLRRTPLGSMGHPGNEAIARAAGIVGRELGWADDRIRSEAAAFARFYDAGH